MELVSPSIDFESEYSVFYLDFAGNDVENAEYYRDGVSDFAQYVQKLTDEAQGLNLPDGYVPCNHFWLIDDDRNILGAIRVRHNIENDFLALEAGHIGYDIAPSYRGKGYGKLMLKLALPKAKLLGIAQVLITADEDNIASRKVIESNGGQFEKVVRGKVFPEPLARYWVTCE
ncbi:GNAT family N-acetyltransferase [Vibrio vulnificus]|uniref:GNAT family N-acetyltransferase n=1 Tax=Vibrio vulnificus TaxID=672 RepID=UPI002878B673|nr:GNAT family N-acetyltransferase [Vibrio vulnificus]MDS1842127.1 GNAT family N-acetyltransferase [Vibrio vulnificus]MDS1850789.1 GNAT family N-acetyltransferase [Vibrio vulnificus]